MAFHFLTLTSLCIILLCISRASTVSEQTDSNSLDDILKIEALTTKTVFDEYSRFARYVSHIRKSTSKKSNISVPQDAWQDILQAFSIFHESNLLRSHDGLPDLPLLLKILEKLALDELSKVSAPSSCINDTGRLIVSIFTAKGWALQFVDAAGKPGPSLTKVWWNFVGNYEQCKAATANKEGKMNQFSGAYFTLPIVIIGVPFPAKLGLCLPDTCSAKQVTQLFHELAANVSAVLVGIATEQNAVTKVTSATVFAIIILVLFGSLTILGTVYDMIYMLSKKTLNHSDVNAKSDAYSNGASANGGAYVSQNSNPDDEAQPLIPQIVVVNTGPNTVGQILLAFSLYSNGKKLLSTSQAEGSLGSIHGIRFLSMTWVVLGHVYLFGSINFTINYSTELPTLLKRWTFDAIANALVSVDTFFTLSGLLMSYLTLQALWSQGLKINWPKVYFHRFWRLTPPYMIVIVIILGLQQYMGHGPFWNEEQPADKKFCEDNWWTNLLYVNNFVKSKEMCLGQSWYLANDMQFFVISPIMLIPFYFHWAAGVGCCLWVLSASWIATGVLSYENNWGDTLFQVMQNPHSNWFNDYYIVPWCRIGPYIIGILAGYVLALSKRRPLRWNWWIAALGWFVAIGAALAVLYGIHGDISNEHISSRSVKALYNTVGRTVWGASVSWVVIACSAGYGGPVNALLSWSPFIVLGRLTYMTYLIHLCIIYVYFGNMGALYYFNDTTMPVMFLGILVFSNMVSFVAVLLFESPMIGLEKVLLPKKRQD